LGPPLLSVALFAVAAFIGSGHVALADESTDMGDDRAAQLRAGEKVYRDLEARGLIVSNSPYAGVLASVGARIARAAALQGFSERFYIIIGNQMNAFSGPDGRVYVNEGLLRQVDVVDELANVLAHESAHLVLGHLAQQMRAARERHFLDEATSFFGHHAPAPGGLNVMGMVSGYSFLNFTRQQEFAADRRGVQIAAQAGFDPWGTVWFLQEVYRLYGDAGYEAYVQHHPSVTDRIAKIEAYFSDKSSYYRHFSRKQPPGTGLPIGAILDRREPSA
jgi:predicted Zn-dependent protease